MRSLACRLPWRNPRERQHRVGEVTHPPGHMLAVIDWLTVPVALGGRFWPTTVLTTKVMKMSTEALHSLASAINSALLSSMPSMSSSIPSVSPSKATAAQKQKQEQHRNASPAKRKLDSLASASSSLSLSLLPVSKLLKKSFNMIASEVVIHCSHVFIYSLICLLLFSLFIFLVSKNNRM